jgi:DUF1365 family protein
VESCLYEGWVHHRRQAPAHAFRFPLFLVYLDLGELDRVFRGRWLWSTGRPALVRFRREDHLGDPQQPLDESVRDLVEARTGRRPGGPVRLLGHLRTLGVAFNPLRLYYCFGPDGRTLEAIVAEVTNTPWNERHCYVLPAAAASRRNGRLRFRTAKDFHVSPFLPMEQTYAWSLRAPGRTLSLHIANLEPGPGGAGERRVFDATLRLERREITGRALARVLARYPWITARTLAAIYAQAWRLRRKGAPFFPHPIGRDRDPREPVRLSGGGRLREGRA